MGEMEWQCVDAYDRDTGWWGQVVPGEAIKVMMQFFDSLSFPNPRCMFLTGCKCRPKLVPAARAERNLSLRARVPPIFIPPSTRQ